MCPFVTLGSGREAALLQVDGMVDNAYRTVYLISCFPIWLGNELKLDL